MTLTIFVRPTIRLSALLSLTISSLNIGLEYAQTLNLYRIKKHHPNLQLFKGFHSSFLVLIRIVEITINIQLNFNYN